MSVVDYTNPVYQKLLTLSAQIECFNAYVELLPEAEDNPSLDVIRHHKDLVQASIEDVWESFSGMSCGLKMEYDE